jgi:uncharacterized peroxidase-related enzyme
MTFVELPAAEADAPNYASAFTLHPEVYRAWVELNTAIKSGVDLRLYELATVAAARRLRSSYCALVHGKVLAEQFLDAATLRALVADPASAELDEADRAVFEFADKVVVDATAVTPEDVDRLRSLGLDEAQIVSVVLAAAARCFFSKTLDALGIEPDARYRDELEPGLRDALVVGRPIASA